MTMLDTPPTTDHIGPTVHSINAFDAGDFRIIHQTADKPITAPYVCEEVPAEIAVCPECGGALWVEVDDYDRWTGVPLEGWVEFWCAGENRELFDGTMAPFETRHGHDAAKWDATMLRVIRWAMGALRVVEVRASDGRLLSIERGWSEEWRGILEARGEPGLPGLFDGGTTQ